MAKFPPVREADLVSSASNFDVKTTAAPTTFGLTAAQCTSFHSTLQAFVTEPYKPVFDPIVGSSDGGMIVYVSQSARGELLVGAEIDPYQSHATPSTLDFIAYASRAALALLPFMAPLRILRQWTGVCDRSPDCPDNTDEQYCLR